VSAIINERTGDPLARQVTLCSSFVKKGRGLMFRRPLREDEAYLFMESRESISLASIHMLFVFFAIGVIWLDADWRVVDMRLARPFRPYYAPSRPARYFVECLPAVLNRIQVGDRLRLTD
jgi:uncharacterized membrane protein (UPF0127 family)